MTDKEKVIKELKETLESLDITNKYRLNLIRAIEYLQEEPISEELEEAAELDFIRRCENHIFGMDFHKPDMISAFKAGAKWQKEQDEETLKDRIINAYNRGMEQMKKQMMAEAIDVEVKVDAGGYPHIDKTIELYDYDNDIPLAKEGDKMKVIIVKDET